MPEALTLKQQVDGLFAALGATDYEQAAAAITKFKGDGGNASQYLTDRDALWKALGATEQGGALTALSGLQSAGADRTSLFESLGVKDMTAATVEITRIKTTATNLGTDRSALYSALGATEQAGAISAIEKLKTDVTAFDHEVEAEVIKRAASAGLPAPVPKANEIPEGSPKAETGKGHIGRAMAKAASAPGWGNPEAQQS